MWEIFPFILNLKVKFVAWKVTVGWPLAGQETASDWALDWAGQSHCSS